MIDSIIRLNFLLQWVLFTFLARVTTNPNDRLKFETQAMGSLIVFQDPTFLPEVMRNKLRLSVKVQLLILAAFMVYLAI